MTLRLTWQVALWEFRLLTRGLAFWLGVLAAAGMAVNLARHGVQSPALLAYGMSTWVLPVIPILFLPVLGALRRRDAAAGVHELIHSRPVGALALVAGKFAAGWGALAFTWLGSMAVGALVVAIAEPTTLAGWLRVVWLSALLVLPCFGFVTALTLAVDALAGRTGAVLAVGTAVVLGSWLYLPSMRASNFLPVFVPKYISDVFGFGPYTGAMGLNRAWVLALTAGLVGLALWALPRRTPILGGPGSRRVAAALLVVLATGGTASALALVPAPAPGEWHDRARPWEAEQVRAAVAGDPGAARHWVRRTVPVGDLTVEVRLAHGNEAKAESIAQAAAQVLAHFPGLHPAAGQPFRVFQGSYLQHGRLESGALVLLGKDVALAGGEHGERAALRAMAEAYWSDLAEVPAWLPRKRFIGHSFPFDLHDTWAAWAALYHQWVVLEQLSGPVAAAAEVEQWRMTGQPREAGSPGAGGWMDLYQSGAVGRGSNTLTTVRALALWELGHERGHAEVLAALRTASQQVPLPADRDAQAWQRAELRTWDAVGSTLGVHWSKELLLPRPPQ